MSMGTSNHLALRQRARFEIPQRILALTCGPLLRPGIEQDSFLHDNQHLSMTQAAGLAADMALHTTRGIAQLLQVRSLCIA
jgi:hypothetical protein